MDQNGKQGILQMFKIGYNKIKGIGNAIRKAVSRAAFPFYTNRKVSTEDIMKYNGLSFHLNNYGYYTNDKVGVLHRYKWQMEKAKIPEGCVIHHKDENKINNNLFNLECMTSKGHNRLHHLGHIHTQEHKNKISASLKGIKRSQEYKDNMSNTMMGHSVSNEARENMSKSHKGKKLSLSTIRKLSKPIRCIETMKEYLSADQAIRDTGISTIRHVLKGRNKTAGGYHWEYV